MELSGRLAAFPPSDLLQWAQNERRTGALVVRRSTREKRVYFRDGAVVACHSDDPSEFYGQHLLLNGYVREEELIAALTHCESEGCRLGEALQQLEILKPEVVRETLVRHIEDTVCDLFLWGRGVFFFAEESLARGLVEVPPIDPLPLAMEGSRWADELVRIRRVFPHDQVVLHHGPAVDGGWELTPLERRIVAQLKEPRPLGNLYRAVGGSFFRFLQAALRLCVREILDIAGPGDDSSRGTAELSVYDLLLEQANEEALPALRHHQLPLEVLSRLVPLWTAGESDDEAERALAARCDGSRRLGEILHAEDGSWPELLMPALRRGALALLPRPLEEMEASADETGSGKKQRWWRLLRHTE